MSKKILANNNFLKNLVKEVIDSTNDEVENLNNLDVEAELQNFIDFLFSANEQGAKSSLEKLVDTGSNLEDIYFATVDKMSNPGPFGDENISEQEEVPRTFPQFDNPDVPIYLTPTNVSGTKSEYIQDLYQLSEFLTQDGHISEADAVLKLIKQLKTPGEAALASTLITSRYLNVEPSELDMLRASNFASMQPVEAGVTNAGGLIVRVLEPVFRWGIKIYKKVFGKTPKSAPKKIKKRANRAKRKERSKGRRQGKNKTRNNKERKPFKRNQKPQKPPKLPKPISKWKQLGYVLGVAFIDELIAGVAGLVEDAVRMFNSGKINLLFEGSQMQYALEKFSEEATSRTIGFQKARLYFSIFSKWDANQIDCNLEDFNQSKVTAGSCSDRMNKPDSYFLPDDVYMALKQDEGNQLEANSPDEYVELYNRYKSFFEEGVTGFVLDNIFIHPKGASMWALMAADNQIEPGLYIKYCFKAILDQKGYNTNNIISEDFWKQIVNEIDGDYVSPDSSVLDILEEYKEEFIGNNFEYSEDSEDVYDIEIVNQIRTHFAAISAASMTSMVDYPGGYNALMECLLNSKMFSPDEKRIKYSIQSDFVNTLVTAIMGGAIDSKAAALLIEAGKKLVPGGKDFKGPSGWLWGLLFVSEMSFYFLDPFNIYDRSVIKARFERISNLIKEEAEYNIGQEQWYMRKDKLELVKSEIDGIYEQILAEINKSLTRFYDLMKTDESACQQLQDKVQIRNAAFKQITLFKQASFQGLIAQEDIDIETAREMKIEKFTISSRNYETILENIPMIEETLIEMHKEIAVPEIGVFMMVPATPPDEYLRILKDPLSKKREKEIQKQKEKQRIKRYDDPTGVTPLNFRSLDPNSVDESLKKINKYILKEQKTHNCVLGIL